MLPSTDTLHAEKQPKSNIYTRLQQYRSQDDMCFYITHKQTWNYSWNLEFFSVEV